ncbi:MAG: 23S rRNA (pseudouridine(1915)-N(3))-methyltransferase RlmH [Bacilli bacterium]|nr:23S rRNA (pseudouridine(1915)-N(3))-methyltransferase RlmH [Bacilli bacterium]
MNITIYCIGKLKEAYWKNAVEEYSKRITPYSEISIIELPDYPTPINASEAEEEAIKEKECRQVSAKLKPNDFLIALDLGHKQVDSVKFAKDMHGYFEKGGSKISFVIGGSLGLSEEIRKRANAFFTLSDLTFPHQLTRVILLEQIYRGFRILHNQPYHK